MEKYYGLKEGDEVIKDKGDYTFEGKVVSVFYKLNGSIRVVVENEAGILHIFNPLQLKSKEEQ